MKVAPSKLREVMRANEVDSLQDTLGGGQVIDGPRSRRAAAVTAARNNGRGAGRPTYAEYGESDIEEDDDEDEEEEDAEAGDDDANDFDELGAEAEGGTDDEDVEMEDAPPPPPTKKAPAQPKPPKITLKPPPAQAKPGTKSKIIVTPASVGPLKPVEDQEMEDDPGDDEVESSELSDDEDVTNLNEEDTRIDEELLDEDAEGEDVELDDDDEDLDDSGDETPASGAATPDPAKLTKRQRAIDEGGLMALDMAPQQRKVKMPHLSY